MLQGPIREIICKREAQCASLFSFCGAAPFHVARPNQVLTCRAALADGTARTVELTVADTAGNVTITGVS